MEPEQVCHLLPGIYRLHFDEASVVAAVGRDGKGRLWMMPSNWISGPEYDMWDKVRKIEFIETQHARDRAAARRACKIANAHGQTEFCCECGHEYPRVDLLNGEIFCPGCRGKS